MLQRERAFMVAPALELIKHQFCRLCPDRGHDDFESETESEDEDKCGKEPKGLPMVGFVLEEYKGIFENLVKYLEEEPMLSGDAC